MADGIIPQPIGPVNITVTYESGVEPQNANDFGCKRYGNLYILDLSVKVTKSAGTGYYKICSIPSSTAPKNNIYTLAHYFSNSIHEVRLTGGSSGGSIGIEHNAACSDKILRFTFVWIK